MTEQTRFLIESLPNFAATLRAADSRTSGPWEIVRWENTPPSEVREHHIHVLNTQELDHDFEANRFTSRTQALRASANWVRSHRTSYNEKGHWGVWRWDEDGKVMFQTVLPINRPKGHSRPLSPANEASEPISSSAIKGNVNGAALTSEGKGTMVRVTEKGYSYLRRMADEDDKTLQAVLEEAIVEYDRKRFFEKADAAYRALRADSEAWEEEQRERKLSEGTLMDGIDRDEVWDADGATTVLKVAEHYSA
jgi:hypothetical protein